MQEDQPHCYETPHLEVTAVQVDKGLPLFKLKLRVTSVVLEVH